MTTKEQIEYYLDPLPNEWKDKLTTLLCDIAAEKSVPDCKSVKDCETVTSLSDFTVTGTGVSVQYKDEKGIVNTKAFDVASLLNAQLDSVEPGCLASQSDWNNKTYAERIQLIIDRHCECCS